MANNDELVDLLDPTGSKAKKATARRRKTANSGVGIHDDGYLSTDSDVVDFVPDRQGVFSCSTPVMIMSAVAIAFVLLFLKYGEENYRKDDPLAPKVKSAWPGIDYYGVLEINRESTTDEVVAASKAAFLKYHPDKCKSRGNTEEYCSEMFQKVVRAKKTLLKSPSKRARYDVLHKKYVDSKLYEWLKVGGIVLVIGYVFNPFAATKSEAEAKKKLIKKRQNHIMRVCAANSIRSFMLSKSSPYLQNKILKRMKQDEMKDRLAAQNTGGGCCSKSRAEREPGYGFKDVLALIVLIMFVGQIVAKFIPGVKLKDFTQILASLWQN